MRVEADTYINGVVDRHRWDRTPAAAFPQQLENAADPWDPAMLASFLELESFDLGPLRERVETELAEREMVTLSELLTRHPLTHGVTELIGYYLVATGHQQAVRSPHHVDREIFTTIELPGGGTFRCPDILFSRP